MSYREYVASGGSLVDVGGNFVIPVASSAPSGTYAGQIYYDTIKNGVYVYDGSSWVPQFDTYKEITGKVSGSSLGIGTGPYEIINVDDSSTSITIDETKHVIRPSESFHVNDVSLISSIGKDRMEYWCKKRIAQTTGLANIREIASSSSGTFIAVVATSLHYVLRSTDNGETWARISTGILPSSSTSVSTGFKSVAWHDRITSGAGTTNQFLIAGDLGYIMRSNDDGLTWTQITTGTTSTFYFIKVLDATGGSLSPVAGGTDILMSSNVAGGTWTAAAFPFAAGETIFDAAVMGSGPNVWIVVGDNGKIYTTGTTPTGASGWSAATWTSRSSGFTTGDTITSAASNQGGTTVVATVAGSTSSNYNRIITSTTGTSWTTSAASEFDAGATYGVIYNRLSVSGIPSGWYMQSSGQILYSSDNGATFNYNSTFDSYNDDDTLINLQQKLSSPLSTSQAVMIGQYQSIMRSTDISKLLFKRATSK